MHYPLIYKFNNKKNQITLVVLLITLTLIHTLRSIMLGVIEIG